MFSIKIDNNIIKEVTEIDINLLSPHEKVIADKKEILKANLKYKDDSVIISSIIICSCLLYTSPSPRDTERSRMPSSA